MKPLISVIVPAYNIEGYLRQCIDSIFNQTYENIEIIIIDDGSTDNTSKIADDCVRKYSNKVRCFHTSNNGVSNARMKGIKEAEGEWIGFVDGDDMIDSDMYERLMDNALKYKADISHCGYRTFVNENRIHYFYNTGKIVKQDNEQGLRDLLEGTFVEPGLWNKLFSKNLFDEILNSNIFDCSIKYTEDALLNFFLFRKSNLAIYEDFCPYQYMSRETSATRKAFSIERVMDPIKVKKIILKNVSKELKQICEVNLLYAELGAYESLRFLKEYKTVISELKLEILKKKSLWKNLRKNSRIRAYMLMYLPHIYKVLCVIYEKFFQDKMYE